MRVHIPVIRIFVTHAGVPIPANDPNAEGDAKGVTAEFNLNLLHRINHELNGDFDLRQFQHVATYDDEQHRIEISLESLCDQVVTISANTFYFAQGELICTEHSHKYTVDGFARMASKVGLTLRKQWTDEQQRFAVLHFAVVD